MIVHIIGMIGHEGEGEGDNSRGGCGGGKRTDWRPRLPTPPWLHTLLQHGPPPFHMGDPHTHTSFANLLAPKKKKKS